MTGALVSCWEMGEKRTPHHMGVVESSMAQKPMSAESRSLFRNFIENTVQTGISVSSMDGVLAFYTNFLKKMRRNKRWSKSFSFCFFFKKKKRTHHWISSRAAGLHRNTA